MEGAYLGEEIRPAVSEMSRPIGNIGGHFSWCEQEGKQLKGGFGRMEDQMLFYTRIKCAYNTEYSLKYSGKVIMYASSSRKGGEGGGWTRT